MKACSMRETQGEMGDPFGYSERSLFTKWLPITASAAAGGAHLPRTPGIVRGGQSESEPFPHVPVLLTFFFCPTFTYLANVYLKDLHLGPQITDTDMNSYWKTVSR